MNKRALSLILGLLVVGGLAYPTVKDQVTTYRQAQVRKTVAQQIKADQADDAAVISHGQSLVAGKFYYQQLSKREQADYIRLVNGLRTFDEDIILKNKETKDKLNRVYLAVLYDFPEFFWLAERDVLDFADYSPTPQQRIVYQELQALGDQIIAQMPVGSDYDKVTYLYEYIIQHTQYHTAALSDTQLARQSQGMRSVFQDQLSVCAGYSRAFQFLCQKAGLEVIYVVGDIVAYDIPHAWNLVKIDGQFYPVDTTWGDPTFEVDTAGQDPLSISYSYLATPKSIFEETHTAWTGFQSSDGNELTYPEVAETGLGYYQQNGAFYEAFDLPTIGQYVTDQFRQSDVKEVTVQFSNQSIFDEALAEFKSPLSGLHQYLHDLPGYQGFQYRPDPYTYTVTFTLLS